jgi:hypothetical protein
MSTSADAREARRQSRFEKLTSSDAQLVAAQPDPAITDALDSPSVLLTDVIRTVMTGLWNHDPDRLQSAWQCRGRAVWKPRYHVLSLPGLFGHVFNMAALDKRTECWHGPPKSTPLTTIQWPGMNSSSRVTREACQAWVISQPDLCGEVRRKPHPLAHLQQISVLRGGVAVP